MIDVISLHIKGDLRAAYDECDKRGIELTAIQCRYKGGIAECFASCVFDAPTQARVVAWFTMPAELVMGFGYPAGTLLHYSHK